MTDEKKTEDDDLDEEVKPRPLHHRIILPIIGVSLIILGIIGIFVPVMPQLLFIIPGIPLALSFHPKTEAWGRRFVRRLIKRSKDAVKDIIGKYKTK